MIDLRQAFVQQPVDFFNADGSSLHNTHVDSTSDAVNIVSEVQALAETFGEDKQSSIEQEQELSVQLSWEAGWLELADDTSHLLVCK